MLVVLKEPIKYEGGEVLVVNITDYEDVRIFKGETFQLVVHKYYDAHKTSMSALYAPLATFDTYKDCFACFEAIIDSLKCGEQVFDLREYNVPTLDNIQSEAV